MQRSPRAPGTSNHLRCAFCGYEIPGTPVEGEAETVFCTDRCREAAEDEEPFAGGFGFKQFTPAVSVLDELLPEGIPANSFVLLAGHEGMRHRGLQTELLYRALNRGEPGIVITYVDPPIAVAEHFLTFGWNVLPFLESGDLRIIDCFTNRLREEHQTPDQQVAWNDFLGGFLEDVVTEIRDPGDLRSVENSLHETLQDLEMVGTGLVIIDSLNEIEFQTHEQATEQFIKEVRGDVCSRNFVPIFASTTVTEDERFAQEHAYLFDGIVDMRRNESLVPGVRLKQLGIRKMDGVRYRPYWVTYENTGLDGFGIYNPKTELDSVYGVPSDGTGPSA